MDRKRYLFVFPIVFILFKNVYALDDSLIINSNGVVTARDNNEEIEFNVGYDPSEGYEKKKIFYPILGDLAPIFLNLGLGLGCMALPFSQDREDEVPINYLCQGILMPSSFLISTFGTIPSHMYSKTPFWKVLTFSAIKISLSVGVGYYVFLGFAVLSGENKWSKYEDSSNWEFIKPLLLINGSIAIIESFEILSQGKSIYEYNRRNETGSEILLGAISNNSFGIKYQINF